jgi:protein-arginine kinase activator protein McsA
MAKKSRLTEVSERIGTAIGKADKQAHVHARKVTHAGKVAKQELHAISKQIDALKKQLEKTSKRMKSVLS